MKGACAVVDLVVGVDLGGTRIRAGAVSVAEPDRVLRSASSYTIKDDPEQGILAIAQLVREVVGPGHLALAIGLGGPGPYSDATHEFTGFANLPAWSRFPIGTRLSDVLEVPVALGNDANVAALGEMRAGAGKGMRDALYVTLGTGVGGAVIIGGEVHSGRTGMAGEFGHVQVDPDGETCGCGKRGCLETISSGRSIARTYGAPAPVVFERAANGERRAVAVLQRAGEALGTGLASAAIAVNPQAVIVGGGLAAGNPAAFQILLRAAEKSLWDRIRMPGHNPIPFIKAQLGDDAGIIGAAHLALREVRGSR
jgi:glucokinase